MNHPAQYLVAGGYEELPKNTPVINKLNIPYWFWISIPVDIAQECNIYQLDQISDQYGEIRFELTSDRVKTFGRKPWVQIATKILRKEAGQHIYRLSYVNRMTTDVISIYFSYIVQDDNPPKPYIYMKRCKCVCCPKCKHWDTCRDRIDIKKEESIHGCNPSDIRM